MAYSFVRQACYPHECNRMSQSQTSLGNGIRKTYIAGTNPAYEPAAKTQEWVRCQGDWQYVEFSSGHDAMVISPQVFAEMLIDGCV
jgi:hypothetical protein